MKRARKRSVAIGICFLAFAGLLEQYHLRGAEDAALGARRSPVAPRDAEVRSAADEAYAKFKGDTSGKNADYIPILAKVDPKLFGVAIITTDNRQYFKGDTQYSFSIQSIAKVYTLALALNELGPDVGF